MALIGMTLRPANNHTGERKGFLDLPIEIRNYIYFMARKPNKSRKEGISVLGCTKILSLCKQIYEEARPYLQPYKPVYVLGIERRPLIRDARANGKPQTYRSCMPTSRYYTYQRCAEIELVRIQKIEIVILQTHSSPKLIEDLRVFVNILRNSTSLSKLDLVIGKWDTDVCPVEQEWLDLVHKLVAICKRKRVKINLVYNNLMFPIHRGELIVDDEDSNQDDAKPEIVGFVEEPLLAYIYKLAKLWNMDLDFDVITHYDRGYDCHGRNADRWNTQRILYEPEGHEIGRTGEELRTEDQELMYDMLGFYHPEKHDIKPYIYVSECRTCYKTFATDAGLRSHLKDKPGHATAFRKKMWSPISPIAGISGDGKREFVTCAQGFGIVRNLDAHYEKYPHHERNGVIPRWVEDNARFNDYWAFKQEKHGWM